VWNEQVKSKHNGDGAGARGIGHDLPNFSVADASGSDEWCDGDGCRRPAFAAALFPANETLASALRKVKIET
jgi:hypothetical protein